MPHYLVQASYTPEAWASLLKNPHERVGVVGKAMDAVGARIVSSYQCFGDYDVVFIMEAPDNTRAAGMSMAFSAGGALKSIKTTPLLTSEGAMEAMRKGATAAASYRPPGS
jgi:uncharacterized protein with GYD domain